MKPQASRAAFLIYVQPPVLAQWPSKVFVCRFRQDVVFDRFLIISHLNLSSSSFSNTAWLCSSSAAPYRSVMVLWRDSLASSFSAEV